MLQEVVTNTKQWSDCLEYISRRVKPQSFSTWFKHTKGEPDGNGSFKLATPNQFVADWIKENYASLIDEALSEVLGRRHEVIFLIAKNTEVEDQTTIDFDSAPRIATRPPVPPKTSVNHNLNPRYTFDSLVVGDFNQFASAASMAVAEAPGMTKYNPLFIYGRTGLGKTHMIQAIGNRIIELMPNKRVLYATSEKFTQDFITSISDGAVSDFTRNYRDIDVLIIDDIQFFTGKESTQEQFFHTFNSLYHSGKQIVLSSDRPTKEIKGLEERLLSRFSWGLVTDLQAPDLENRMAIIYKKLNMEGTSLQESVVRFIADRVYSNIRDLEGALIRLFAYASLQKVAVDLELAKRILSDSLQQKSRDLTIELIQKHVSQQFGIDPGMMTAKKKSSHIALARQVAMYLSRSLTNHSLKVIGLSFGGRDHSTVIHACDLVERRLSEDPGFRDKLDKVSASLLY